MKTIGQRSVWIVAIAIALLLTVKVSSVSAQQNYGVNFCSDSRFKCIKVKHRDTWKSLFPDPEQRELVKRLNRINTALHRGMHIAVPKKMDGLDLLDIAPFQLNIASSGHKQIIVDPNHLAWGAYDEQGRLLRWGPISGGKSYCEDVNRGCRTIQGSFHILYKQGVGCKSSKFPLEKPGAPMPYCMHFYKGFALHGSPSVPGYNDSHGCVRLFIEDAKWLNEEFISLPGSGRKTTVIVKPYQSQA